MKPSSRIKLAANVGNSPDGFIYVRVEDFEGGNFDLSPLTGDDAILLPHPTDARYSLGITGSNPAALKRLANALNTLARKIEGGDDTPEQEGDV